MKFLVNVTITHTINHEDFTGMATTSFNLVKESEDGQFGYDLVTDDIQNYRLLEILNDVKLSDVTQMTVDAVPLEQ